MPTLRLFDAIEGGSDLSTSDHEDCTWFGCESTWIVFLQEHHDIFGGFVPIRMSRLCLVSEVVGLP